MPHAAGPHDVRKKARHLVKETWQSEANLSFFLAMLVVAVFVLPLTDLVARHLTVYIDITYSLLLVSGVVMAWNQRWLLYVSAIITAAALAVRWLAWFIPTLVFWREGMMLVSILIVTVIVLDKVFRKGPVTAMRLQGAVAAYLLFGMAWAHAFVIATAFNPNSFSTPRVVADAASEWVYYSFVTLTTVGYGDIVPSSRAARMLAVGEALTGQLYLTVLVARLVALQVSDSVASSGRDSA